MLIIIILCSQKTLTHFVKHAERFIVELANRNIEIIRIKMKI